MSENEKMIEPERNPYDHLIEPEAEPVRSPVILGNANEPEKTIKHEASIEIIPLAGEADYNKISVGDCRTVDVIYAEVEEDLLVPDTFPDMEAILNMDAVTNDVNVYSENGGTAVKGKIKLETIYRSDETYGSNICVLPAEMNFNSSIKYEGAVRVEAVIRKIDYRIINERKYKAKISVTINVKSENETDYLTFAGITGEKLFLRKSKINLLNLITCKKSESDISETLLINDEKIRPVKILKSKVTIAENHRQLTNDKLILNQTLWVRVLYLAEISSKGNLSNQPVLFHGKIDNTQFIPMSKNDEEVVSCKTTSITDNIRIEINRESSGFEVSGEIITEVECYNYKENELITDFYHEKEEMTCDYKTENVCTGFNHISIEQPVKETISMLQESGEEHRVIYMDAKIVDPAVSIEGNSVYVRGKVHIEAVTMNEGDYTTLAKKICDFSCIKELSHSTNGCPQLDSVFVREMKCDIMGSEINVTASLQANVYIYDETEVHIISKPCFVKNGEPKKHYPITIHTVMEGESIWEIGKKYKVAEERITAYNKEENIRPGNKIIIVK